MPRRQDRRGLLDADRFDGDASLGHRQVTDAWWLGSAVDRGLRLVTFDSAMARAS